MLRTCSRRILNHENAFIPSQIKFLSGQNQSPQSISVYKNILDKNKNTFQRLVAASNELIGFDEIDKLYKAVSSLQEKLHIIQNERSAVQLQLANARKDLANIQSNLQEHKRGEPKYMDLIRKEFELTKQKNHLEEEYSIRDQTERELFSHLQSKINILHETSRTHTRQWGIISTVIGAFLGIIGTSISAYYRNKDIRRMQQTLQDELASRSLQFQAQVDSISKDTNEIVRSYNSLIENLNQLETTIKASSVVKSKQKSSESWMSYFKRKTVFAFKFCTFQKTN